MQKRLELAKSLSCLNKADPKEPIFVLRAKDELSSAAVRLWAAMAVGIHEEEKIEEALQLAHEMEKWRKRFLEDASEGFPCTSTINPPLERKTPSIHSDF